MTIQANSSLSFRVWNGTPINRRTTDNYVNATAMCKANDKQWHDYWRTDRATEYLEALESETGISVSNLCLTMKGGAHQGTWVHPQVAVDLARWISAPFAVWMDHWFLESIQTSPAVPAESPAPKLAAADVITLVQQSISLFDRLGGLDQRDELLFKDIIRSTVLSATTGSVPALPGDDEELTLSDAWLFTTGSPLPRGKGPIIGRVVAELFRKEFATEPPCRTQYVDGAPRQVKSYKRGWLLNAVNALCSRFSVSTAASK